LLGGKNGKKREKKEKKSPFEPVPPPFPLSLTAQVSEKGRGEKFKEGRRMRGKKERRTTERILAPLFAQHALKQEKKFGGKKKKKEGKKKPAPFPFLNRS